MTRTITPLVITSFCLFFCSGAWAWTKNGNEITVTNIENEICNRAALDAAAIMLSRQRKVTLDFFDNEKYPPSEGRKEGRIKLEEEAASYPIETSEEKQNAVSEKFSNMAKGRCFKAYMVLVPPSNTQ